MKYGKVNLGQIEALINILGGEDKLNDIISGELKVTLEKSKRLSISTTFYLGQDKLDLLDFFTNSEGVITSEQFNSLVLPNLSEGCKIFPEGVLGYRDILRYASNAELFAELKNLRDCESLEYALSVFVRLIKCEPIKGLLNDDSNDNLFFITRASGEKLVISICRNEEEKVWYFNAFVNRPHDNGVWTNESRIFYLESST